VLVRDSADAVRVPGRNNVFEYGYPEPDPAPAAGAPGQADAPVAGGLSGLIEDDLRNNA
jgi:hypothetical protein